MEKYYIFGIIAAFAVFAVVLVLFGVGKSRNYTVNMPQGAYNIANLSLKNSVYNDILGLQTYQNIMPNGKNVMYNVNYSISTSQSLSNGSGSNTSELSKGYVQLIRGLNGNSEAFSNFSGLYQLSSGLSYNLTSLSYVFSLGNNSYLCLGSSQTLNKVSCESFNESFENISDYLLNSLDNANISLLKAYNTTYKGYPCLFTVSYFSLSLNTSNDSLLSGNQQNEQLQGVLTSCLYRPYNITLLNSLAASASISTKINSTNMTIQSFISYNESISKLSDFNKDITKNSLPNTSS